MMKFPIGLFFVLHGLVHLLWFGVYWRYFTIDTIPYSTSILAGRIEIGDTGARVVGLIWVFAGFLWVVSGLSLLLLAPWWTVMTITAALFSSLLCLTDLRNAKYGLLINLIVLGLIFLNGRNQWV